MFKKLFNIFFQKKVSPEIENRGGIFVRNEIFVPRNLERISKQQMLQQKSLHMLIDLSVKGNYECMSCGNNVAYYKIVPMESQGSWPPYNSVHVTCECGRENEDICGIDLTQSDIENVVKYVWNELNDFDTRMREMEYSISCD